MVWAASGQVPADLAHPGHVGDAESVEPFDYRLEAELARPLEREPVVEQPEERPDRARGVVVLRPPEEQRAPPLDVPEVHVVAERDGGDRAGLADGEHQLGLGVAPDRGRMDANPGAGAHRGHGRALREQFRVRADADLEVRGPHAPADQDLLDARRLRGTGLDPAQIRPDDGLDLTPRPVGEGGVPARPLLDDALEQARHERHPAGLHCLQIAGREQPWLRGIALALRAVGDDLREQPDRRRLADRRADVGRMGCVQEMAGGRIRPGQIDGLSTSHRDDRWSPFRRDPGPTDEQGIWVTGHAVAGRQAHASRPGGPGGRPGDRPAGRSTHPQRPLNAGRRFSMNARRPST
jgi:hypothetical protein